MDFGPCSKVGDLIAAKLDGMIAGGEVGIDLGAGFAEWFIARVFDGVVAAVVGRQLLLDDVGFDGDAEVIGLAGEIGGGVVIDAVDFESIVTRITPEDGDQAQLVGTAEGFGDFDNLAFGFGGAEIDRGADGDGAHIEGLFHLAEHDLVEFFGDHEEGVVVELHHEGDFVGVLAADRVPRTPSVEATQLQPPSMASFTIFSGSKYWGLGAKLAPAECSMP